MKIVWWSTLGNLSWVRFGGKVAEGFVLCFFAWGLICLGGAGSEAVRDGMDLCGRVIVPSLFPFFILSQMVMDLGFSRWFGALMSPVMKPFFRLPRVCGTALVLGLVGGYPVGAKTTLSLYQRGECSLEEGNRLLAFSNNGGPGFLLGVIGIGMYQSAEVGALLYLAHALGACTVGVFLAYGGKLFLFGRNQEKRLVGSEKNGSMMKKGVGDSSGNGVLNTGKTGYDGKEEKGFLAAFLDGVTGAMDATLRVCGFILCFTVLLRLLTVSGVLVAVAEGVAWVLPESFGVLSYPLVLGFVELTSGVTALEGGSFPVQMGVLSFFLGWGGLSIHAQTLSILGDSDLSGFCYLKGKLFHGLVSGGYGYIFGHFLVKYMEIQPYVVSAMGVDEDRGGLFLGGHGTGVFLVGITLVLSYFFYRKGWKKSL